MAIFTTVMILPFNIKPKLVFDNPDQHWDFLTAQNDRDFEGQFFDRKELCRAATNGVVRSQDLKEFKLEHIAQTISAFANQNHDGGLLVLGISKHGTVTGLKSLTEEQINSLGDISYLKNHNSQFKLHKVIIDGQELEIGLVYTPYCSNGICETVAHPKRSWKRSGMQNIELTDDELQRIKREKRVVNFEVTHCAKFEDADLEQGVYKEFSHNYFDNSTYARTTSEILFHLGATTSKDTEAWFTNAGALFFSVNPERNIPQAFIRLLRFDVPYEERQKRPTPTYDKKFSGPITKQIRDFRTFIKDSAFFDVYQIRKGTGGFIEEPEYPSIAIDEAIVNAVAHRDYGIAKAIYCEKYTDAFAVTSPGGIIQGHNLPEHFSLQDVNLEHLSRNPKLIEWLRQMKDAHGRAFVQALQEGTRRMRDEMTKLNLPAPEYITSSSETVVILKNNALQRKIETTSAFVEDSPEFTNLYPLIGVSISRDIEKNFQLKKEILGALRNKLTANGWFIDRASYGIVTAHRKGLFIPAPERVSNVVKLYPSYIFQVKEYFGKAYLLADYTVTVQSVCLLNEIVQYFQLSEVANLSCICQFQGWSKGKILSIENDYSNVYLYDQKTEEKIPNNKIIPRLPPTLIKQLLEKKNISYDLSKEIRRAIFGLDNNASRKRVQQTQAVIDDLIENIFPLKSASLSINLSSDTLKVSQKVDGTTMLRADSLGEPQVEFSKHRSSADVREGITQFGSYDHSPKDIEVIPLCGQSYVSNMEGLIERLRTGKYKYKGSERTFGVKLTYNTVIISEPENLQREISRLLSHHPEWKGNAYLSRLFLIHCPETNYAIDDERAPYYQAKRLLLEAGIPCQMVDTPTLLNADFKDLNLALNIIAKCGQAPWVLPESIPDCDFFIGLSYTQNHRKDSNRIMAFANVFNEYGRWEFYSGGSETFSFGERTKHYERLVRDTLGKMKLSENPTICFHYTARFSKVDRDAIFKAAQEIRPNGKFVFVWINTQHNVRFYDERTETNGSLARGRYVIGSPNQIYLSTTGHNPYRKTLGTPQALELNITIEGPSRVSDNPDLRVLASQALSLTKLNWASTDSLCAEPITTKYAGDIAYLTAAFMRQSDNFKLHEVLERTPWFI